jgi:hypothetical protein
MSRSATPATAAPKGAGRTRVRTTRGTVRPAVEAVATLPSPPPVVQLPRIQETVDMVLETAFRNPPFNADKATNLMLLLTPLSPPPLTPDSRERLIAYCQIPPTTSAQVVDLIQLLQALVDASNALPPDQSELVRLNFPISLEDPRDFNPEKAHHLELLLTSLDGITLPPGETNELIELLRSPPTTQDGVDRLKALLTPLRDSGNPMVINNLPITLVGPREIQELKRLQFPTGTPILSLTDRPLLYEVVGLLINLGLKTVADGYTLGREFLARVQSPGDIIFNSPLLKEAQDKYQVDYEILRTKVKVAPGVTPCPRCGSREVVYVEKQIRSADEPMTIKFTCIACGKKWNIG